MTPVPVSHSQDGTLIDVEKCTVRDPSLYQPNFANSYTSEEIAQLHFVGQTGPIGGGTQHWVSRGLAPTQSRFMTQSRKLHGFFSDLGNLLFGGGGGGHCDDCPSMDQFNSLSSSVETLRQKQVGSGCGTQWTAS